MLLGLAYLCIKLFWQQLWNIRSRFVIPLTSQTRKLYKLLTVWPVLVCATYRKKNDAIMLFAVLKWVKIFCWYWKFSANIENVKNILSISLQESFPPGVIFQRWCCPAGSSAGGSAVQLISSPVVEQKMLSWTDEKAKVCSQGKTWTWTDKKAWQGMLAGEASCGCWAERCHRSPTKPSPLLCTDPVMQVMRKW